jgi:hypothetical protein
MCKLKSCRLCSKVVCVCERERESECGCVGVWVCARVDENVQAEIMQVV